MTDETKPSHPPHPSQGDVYSEVDSLNALSWSLRESDIKRALELADNARLLSLNTRIPYKNGAATSYKILGQLYLEELQYEKALANFLEASDLYADLDFKEEQLQVNELIAELYASVGALVEASTYYKSALSFSRELDDAMMTATLFIALTRIDLQSEQYRNARNRITHVLIMLNNLMEDRPDKVRVMEAQARFLLSQINTLEGDYNDARMHGLDALALLTDDELALQIDIMMHLGDVNQTVDELSTALLYFQRVIDLTRATEHTHMHLEATIKVHALSLKMGDAQAILKKAERLKKLVRERGTLAQREQVYLLLAQAYDSLSMYQQQAPYLKRLMELKDFRCKREQQMQVAQHSQLHTVQVKHLQKSLRLNMNLGNTSALLTNNAHVDLLREQLNQEIREREVLIDELNAFSYTVARDLKSPLNVISGFTDILREALAGIDGLDEDVYKSLTMIDKTTHKMDAIIEDLMLLAGVRDNDQVTFYPIDMASLIEGVEDRLSYEIQAHNATINKPDRWIKGIGYGPWVEAIWVNYVSNAIKYGGQPPYIVLGSEQTDPAMVRYWVKDNGQGVPEEHREHVFTQFRRLNEGLTKGHGIGLSIVKRIANRLGGDVGVENPAEGGSLFYFTLPSFQLITENGDDD